MIGNAVPVNLARFVGETINEYVRFNEDKQREEPINTYDPYRANHPTQLSIFEPQAEYIPKQQTRIGQQVVASPKTAKKRPVIQWTATKRRKKRPVIQWIAPKRRKKRPVIQWTVPKR